MSINDINNIYVLDKILKLYKIRSLDFYLGVDQLCKIDSIRECNKLIQEIRNLDKTKSLYVPGELCQEGINYGHIGALYNYAGKRKRSNIYTPLVEHGVRFGEDVGDVTDSKYNYCQIAQGVYRKSMIHEYNPHIPVYSVGPYIHYAKSFYDEKTIEDNKKKNGKTVVVFHSHAEEVRTQRNNIIINEIKEQFKGIYDTIILCGYWFNLDQPFIEDCLNQGIKIVSAGVRWDKNFIRRLRTILEIADAIAVDDIGTQMGYAMCLGKKVEILNSLDIDAIVTDDTYNFNKKRIFTMLKNGDNEGLEAIYNKYWGGNMLRSKEEIGAILDNCHDILKNSNYRLENYSSEVDKQIEYLERNKSEYNDLKLRLLKEALED